MWYVAAVGGMGGGGSLFFIFFYAQIFFLIIKQKNLDAVYFILLCFNVCTVGVFQSAAECGGSGERLGADRQAAAADRCRELRLQQILQLLQNRRGLLRPLFNR